MLTGDATDGYKGLPGCGPKGAIKVLGEPPTGDYSDIASAWEWVVGAYARKGLTEDDAIVQARVARILTEPKGATEWWTPPTAQQHRENE